MTDFQIVKIFRTLVIAYPTEHYSCCFFTGYVATKLLCRLI